ncbi:hypothetical protein [Flindersiella endophytica]
MPADEERQVDDELSRLRSDVDQVDWSDASAVRHRGQQRGRQQAAAGTLALVLSVGVLGVAATGRFPGQDGQSPLITAAQNSKTQSAGSEDGSETSKDSHGEGGGKDGSNPRTGESTHKNNDPSSDDPKAPTATATATTPAGSVTPTPTKPGSETPGPTDPTPTSSTTVPTPPELTAAALLTSDLMPTVNDTTETWSATGDTDGEGAMNASVCADGSLAGLGARSVIRRDYSWGPAGSTVVGDNVVGVFETSEAAGTAFDSYSGWIGSCAWANQPQSAATEVTVDGGTARWWVAKKTTSDTTGEIEVVGLVRRGMALSVIVWHQEGQDLNYQTDPMAASLKSSASRLESFGG